MSKGAHPREHTVPHESDHEHAVRHDFAHLLTETPIPPEERVDNLTLYLCRSILDGASSRSGDTRFGQQRFPIGQDELFQRDRLQIDRSQLLTPQLNQIQLVATP